MSKSRLGSLVTAVLVLLILVVLLAVAVLYWLGRPQAQAVTIEKIQAREGVPVEVTRPVVMDFVDWLYCDGEVVASVRAVPGARVAEIVEAVHVRVGEPVEPGQVLIQFRSADLEAAIVAARAAYEEALRNYSRYERLVAERVLSEDRLEQARTRRDAAASLLREAESGLQYAQVVSPVGGIVESRWVEPGEYKREGDELLSIVDLSAVEVSALVPERDVGGLSVGMEGQFQTESSPQWLSGRISRISPATQDPNRFFDVYVKVDNRRTGEGWLMLPGMYAQARFVRGVARDALAVRDDTIVWEGNERVVYVVEEATAQFAVETAVDPEAGFFGRLKRGWTRLGAGRGKAQEERYEERQAKKARRVLVSLGLREGELVQLRQGDVGPSSLLIVNASDDVRDGTVVSIVKGGQ